MLLQCLGPGKFHALGKICTPLTRHHRLLSIYMHLNISSADFRLLDSSKITFRYYAIKMCLLTLLDEFYAKRCVCMFKIKIVLQVVT